PRPARPTVLRASSTLAVGLLALTLASCSSTPETSAAPTDATTTPATSATQYPLTLDNCGVEVTFDAAPTAVVTIKSSTTEMLLALGVGDRIVGTAYPDGPVADWLAEDAATNPAIATPLADKVPG